MIEGHTTEGQGDSGVPLSPLRGGSLSPSDRGTDSFSLYRCPSVPLSLLAPRAVKDVIGQEGAGR
jgi:hypothetical protein